MMRKITTRNVSVNVAKVVTLLCLLGLPLFFETGVRQALYLAMHASYCVWYLLKQIVLREVVFREPDSLPELALVVAVVGVGYALPGWLAFRNPEPVANFEIAVSVALFFFGSVINSGADVQKITALRAGPGLIRDGFWSLSRNINYFGDVLRYCGFALLSGSAWAWLVVLTVLSNNWARARKKAASLSRYPEYATYRRGVPAFLPYGRIRNPKDDGLNLRFKFSVNAPVEAAFAYYLDESRLSEWVEGGGMLEFTPLTRPPKRVGSRYRMVYRILGVTFRSITQLSALEPCRFSAKDQISGDYRAYHYEMHFTPAGSNRTEMEMRVHLEMPWGFLGRIAGWLGRPLILRERQAALARFKRQAEAYAGAQPENADHLPASTGTVGQVSTRK